MKNKRPNRQWLKQVVQGGLTRLNRRTNSHPPNPSAPLPAGILRPDLEKIKMQEQWAMEQHETAARNPNRVVLILVILAIVWIGLIAWFVSEMPVTKS